MAPDQPPINDPFGSMDGQRTFIKPNPGGWSTGRTQIQAPAAAPAPPDLTNVSHGLNPLLAEANSLLMLVPRLRHTRQVADPAALRASLAQGVRDFEKAAQERGIAPERAMAARYVLCTMIDEAASDTPWGGAGLWGRYSLLVEFHNEVSGGEKVFQLMARLAEKPDANLDLLELIYAAVSLGFEGRYRVIEGGRVQLDAVRTKLAQIIRVQRGAYPAVLAEHWHATPAPVRKVLSWLPLSVAAAVSILLLGGLYAAYAWSLSGRADPVYEQIQRLRLAPPVAPVAQPAAQPRLAQFLQPEIKAGLVAVRDDVDRSVITIRGDGLFAPASANRASEREALMKRIAEALAGIAGPVLVTGHTDNTAMRSLRFPSNWHLSDERARVVRDLMIRSGLSPDRIKAEGRADGEPAAPNDTAANRAINRRVEITLVTAKQSGPAAATPPATPAPPAAAPAASR